MLSFVIWMKQSIDMKIARILYSFLMAPTSIWLCCRVLDYPECLVVYLQIEICQTDVGAFLPGHAKLQFSANLKGILFNRNLIFVLLLNDTVNFNNNILFYIQFSWACLDSDGGPDVVH